jgi:hypothetical protein
MNLPEVYLTFYKKARRRVPPSFVGSDLFNDEFNLKEAAIELLKENGVANFLTDLDYVFMMHQGYQFYYFKVDGNPNPDVMGYTEVGNELRNFGKLADFLREDT